MNEKMDNLTEEQVTEKAKEVLTILQGLTTYDAEQVIGEVRNEISKVRLRTVLPSP